MEILSNRPISAIYFSSAIEFENRPLLGYLAEKSAIRPLWIFFRCRSICTLCTALTWVGLRRTISPWTTPAGTTRTPPAASSSSCTHGTSRDALKENFADFPNGVLDFCFVFQGPFCLRLPLLYSVLSLISFLLQFYVSVLTALLYFL